jgi:hypothetical protein
MLLMKKSKNQSKGVNLLSRRDLIPMERAKKTLKNSQTAMVAETMVMIMDQKYPMRELKRRRKIT